MTSLYETAARIREVADSKGWQKPDWETNFIHKLAFTVTELNEAVEGVHGTQADPLDVELADTVIRLLDVVHALWPEKWSPGRIEGRIRPVARIPTGLFQPIEVGVWPILKHLSHAIESWRVNDPTFGKKDAMVSCELAILETFRLADRLGLDLDAAIERKVAYNATRQMLHGKGRNVG